MSSVRTLVVQDSAVRGAAVPWQAVLLLAAAVSYVTSVPQLAVSPAGGLLGARGGAPPAGNTCFACGGSHARGQASSSSPSSALDRMASCVPASDMLYRIMKRTREVNRVRVRESCRGCLDIVYGYGW